ncbi:hypothetical protein [Klebsiella grimontii]|uniref:hypothetical protein n=1 Tax=Klebsiella grimontii TaxID=2058152 RepID=UPI0012B880E9|nr:hypothetical protein [Klebsiella grimontii]EGT0066769.1 hypothetical protein [Klebsiella michiganensis]WDI68757.1 hypothetical protein PU992_20775 [Klebsiella grimontii]
MRKTTAVIDSPEALGAALCRHVPDMANGFTITTQDSQLQLTVAAEDTRPFMAAMERLLKGKIRQIQRRHQGSVIEEKCVQTEAGNLIVTQQIRQEDRIRANNMQVIEQIKGLNAQAIQQIARVGFPELTSEEWESINQIVRAAALRKKNGPSASTAI